LVQPGLTKKPAKGQTRVDQSDLLGLAGYNMKRAYMCLYQDFRESLAEFGLRQRTFSSLSLVINNPDLSQSEVARTLGIERSGTVIIIDELESRNLIFRDKVPGDRRSYALRPTPAGRRLYKRALEKIHQHENKMLASFTDTERHTLLSLLKRIHDVDED